MVYERFEVNSKVKKIMSKYSSMANISLQIANRANQRHKLSKFYILSVLNGQTDVLEVPDEILYWILEAANAEYKQHGIKEFFPLSDWYSESEIMAYSISMIEEESLYPVVIHNCIPVNEDQYVTVMDTTKIIELYNKQLIHYNQLTQRQPTIKTRKGITTYVITIVKKSVEAISKLMSQNLYIPDDLTFNINPESGADYTIDGTDIILTEGVFDIIDGFHRLIAISDNHRNNPQFSYRMVINITMFQTEKACRYIAQKDKRNKLTKSYSASLDSTNEVTSIVNRINERSNYFRGCITRLPDAKINWTSIFALIDYNFKVKTKREGLDVQNYIIKGLDYAVEELPDLVSHTFSNKDLCILVRTFSKFYYGKRNYQDAAKAFISLFDEDFPGNFPLGSIRPKLFKDIDRRLSEYVQ